MNACTGEIFRGFGAPAFPNGCNFRGCRANSTRQRCLAGRQGSGELSQQTKPAVPGAATLVPSGRLVDFAHLSSSVQRPKNEFPECSKHGFREEADELAPKRLLTKDGPRRNICIELNFH